MRLIFPKNKDKWNANQLPIVPTDLTPNRDSGWLLVAAAQSGNDVYVCMLRQDRTQVSIEKGSKLSGKAHMTFESLFKIDDSQEFVMAHQYFINEGFLDATVSNQ